MNSIDNIKDNDSRNKIKSFIIQHFVIENKKLDENDKNIFKDKCFVDLKVTRQLIDIIKQVESEKAKESLIKFDNNNYKSEKTQLRVKTNEKEIKEKENGITSDTKNKQATEKTQNTKNAISTLTDHDCQNNNNHNTIDNDESKQIEDVISNASNCDNCNNSNDSNNSNNACANINNLENSDSFENSINSQDDIDNDDNDDSDDSDSDDNDNDNVSQSGSSYNSDSMRTCSLSTHPSMPSLITDSVES